MNLIGGSAIGSKQKNRIKKKAKKYIFLSLEHWAIPFMSINMPPSFLQTESRQPLEETSPTHPEVRTYKKTQFFNNNKNSRRSRNL